MISLRFAVSSLKMPGVVISFLSLSDPSGYDSGQVFSRGFLAGKKVCYKNEQSGRVGVLYYLQIVLSKKTIKEVAR